VSDVSQIPSMQYQLVCHDKLRDLEKKVGEMHPKIMNGLSSLPKQLSWISAVLITILLAVFGYIINRIEKIDSTVRSVEIKVTELIVDFGKAD